MQPETYKLDKFIALQGFCSRRKAYDLISKGQVIVNGKKATHSTKVSSGDKITIAGEPLGEKPFVPVIIAYNKPKGIVCTTEKIEGNIIDALQFPSQIFPVGRLDKNSEGLMLLTNQGELIDRIANAASMHEKEYEVTVNLPLRKQFLDAVRQGMNLQGDKTRPAVISPVPGTKRVFRIILTQGLNRQIRRMCTAFDYQVIRLLRLRVMHVQLGHLKPGQWRHLEPGELDQLMHEL